MSGVLFHIPDIVCKMSVLLVKSGFFIPPRFQSCSRELCVPCLTYICKALGSLGVSSQMVVGSGFSASLNMQHEAEWLKFCCFASAATLWWSPAQPEAEVKKLCHIIVMSCSSRHDFCNRQKVHAFMSLNGQGYGFELCGVAQQGWVELSPLILPYCF